MINDASLTIGSDRQSQGKFKTMLFKQRSYVWIKMFSEGRD